MKFTSSCLSMLTDLSLKKKKSIWLPGRCPHGKRNSSANVKSILQREKANHCGAQHLHHGPQPVFAVIANHTEGDAEQGPLSIPSSGELGAMALFQTCSVLIYSFPLLFFLTLKLQRLLKYNKVYRRATRMTNSAYSCPHNQCTLVKAPPHSADLSPAKWRAPSCELDSFALVTWQTDSRVVPHDPTFRYSCP